MPLTPLPSMLETPRKSSGLYALADSAARGDMQAISALLKQLAPGMIRNAHAILGSRHPDVDDVIQQSLIALVQALPAFRGECSPPHYASRIVARTAVAASHRARLRHDRRDDASDVDDFEAAPTEGPDAVDAHRRRAAMRELMATLPAEQAETLALRVVLGFSLQEVAAATETPLNTVRSRIRLAKEALRRRIEADPALQQMLEVES